MGFVNHTDEITNETLPINAEHCPEWNNDTYGVTD